MFLFSAIYVAYVLYSDAPQLNMYAPLKSKRIHPANGGFELVDQFKRNDLTASQGSLHNNEMSQKIQSPQKDQSKDKKKSTILPPINSNKSPKSFVVDDKYNTQAKLFEVPDVNDSINLGNSKRNMLQSPQDKKMINLDTEEGQEFNVMENQEKDEESISFTNPNNNNSDKNDNGNKGGQAIKNNSPKRKKGQQTSQKSNRSNTRGSSKKTREMFYDNTNNQQKATENDGQEDEEDDYDYEIV
ncbi:UNKNOWN [Stylonychia lemnae]|uniref:Uncharacterized protein n=1 Tax=Stylonychia lemnae TaxID=5949 RepID=A0A078ABQ3_STYLE|nr:UNKNOWN [Stylonychia lemnae]|eukprot:CDW79725.1 UNKNOWN [Stylonychia lemnae]